MSETEWPWPDIDPDDSPFEAQAITWQPYEDGSEEDLAIKQILARKAARERAQDESSAAT
jgi:hypothetical protein